LRLSAVPSEPLTQEAARIVFLPPSAESANDEGEAEDEVLTEIGIGATVRTIAEALNLRAEPSTSANSLAQLSEGIELLVIGGPEEADDYTWWQVQGIEDESIQGWLASDFLEFVSGAPADGTQQAAGTPEATPAGTPEASPAASPSASGEFPVGAVVAITEENVRIRQDASLTAEPVEVFAAGTEFEITGAAVEADDYTWYPVELVADPSVTGWVVVDFIEPAADGQ
jgi:hypothetical protein